MQLVFRATLFAILTLVPLRSDAQQWNGGSTASGDIHRTGRVGIGTTSPGVALDVDGAIHATEGIDVGISRLYQSELISTYPMGLTVMGSESQYGWDWIRDASTVLTIRHPSYARSTQLLMSYKSELFLRKPEAGTGNWKSWVRIIAEDEQTGNVGIGTSSPPEKLSVDGNILAEEVIVELSTDWPDYVFDKAYRLPPLDEVAQHISTHGSLPGIPTAKEVARGGIRLGQTDAQLLQKIEELTLYAIEQEHKASAHTHRIDALSQQNEALTERLKTQAQQIQRLTERLERLEHQ